MTMCTKQNQALKRVPFHFLHKNQGTALGEEAKNLTLRYCLCWLYFPGLNGERFRGKLEAILYWAGEGQE